jgi:AcrR family transcriptional regulator
MSRSMSSLTVLHSDHTERLILETALAVLRDDSFNGLTVRAVARKAGISERTIFRYFPTREEFLDAVAREFTRILGMPPAPQTVDELLAMPRRLYTAFEPHARLIAVVFHTEIFPRMKAGPAQQRWEAIGRLLERERPKAPPRARRIAAANIRYFLSAATWHYYRFIFRFTLEETIACAETAIRQTLRGLSAAA